MKFSARTESYSVHFKAVSVQPLLSETFSEIIVQSRFSKESRTNSSLPAHPLSKVLLQQNCLLNNSKS